MRKNCWTKIDELMAPEKKRSVWKRAAAPE